MSNSKKLLIFFSAFFGTLFFIIALTAFFGGVLKYNNPITDLSIKTFSFIFFIFLHASLRKNAMTKIIKELNVVKILPVTKFTLNQKSWLYLVVILIYYLPVLKDRDLSYLNAYNVSLSIIALVLVELLLRLSNKSTFFYFTDKGIAINGLDLRLIIPIVYGGQNYNDSNLYTYDKLHSYVLYDNKIDVEDNYRRKILFIQGDLDSLKQVEGLLKRNKVKPKKVY